MLESGLLWGVAMETESWDIWLWYNSCADNTAPTVSARNARTLSSWQRSTCRLVFMVSSGPAPPPQCSWFSMTQGALKRRVLGVSEKNASKKAALAEPTPSRHTWCPSQTIIGAKKKKRRRKKNRGSSLCAGIPARWRL